MDSKFKNEAEFRKALTRRLKEDGCRVFNVESGQTAPGIPDLFVVDYEREANYWLELKRKKGKMLGKFKAGVVLNIGLRPAQIAWQAIYNQCKHEHICFTLVAYDDCILAVTIGRMIGQLCRMNGLLVGASLYDGLHGGLVQMIANMNK